MTNLYPMLIRPRFDRRIWGGNYLATHLGKDAPRDEPIGESWEIYDDNPVENGRLVGETIAQLRAQLGRDLTGHVDPDRPFPLLTKLIDARDVLSVQVHPDDAAAQRLEGQPNGKTECWYILHAEPGAELTFGFQRDMSPEKYTELVASGKLDGVLRSLPVEAGDVVYIPAGTVHAIGAGIVLFELQQTSDVTYRIYDWNRVEANGKPRELHVEKARQVLAYRHAERGTVRPLQWPDSGRTTLIAAEYFTLELIAAGVAGDLPVNDSAVAICALDEAVVVQTDDAEPVTIPPYSSALIPAAAHSYRLEPLGGNSPPARALVAWVPTSLADTRAELRAQGFSDEQLDTFLAQFAPLSGLGTAPE